MDGDERHISIANIRASRLPQLISRESDPELCILTTNYVLSSFKCAIFYLSDVWRLFSRKTSSRAIMSWRSAVKVRKDLISYARHNKRPFGIVVCDLELDL